MSYRQIFDQAIGEAPPTRIDLDQLVRRQRRATRLRPVLAGLAATVVVLAGAATAVQATGWGQPPPPADRLAGFPEYLEGTRVFAAVSAPLADRTLTLSFVPTTLDLQLFSRCEGHGLDPDIGLRAELVVGPSTSSGPFCPKLGMDYDVWAGGEWKSDDPWKSFWSTAGVATGTPVTVTVRLTRTEPLTADTAEPVPVPTEGTFALAVGERVAFEDYPPPPRPETLPPLEPFTEPVDVDLRPDPDDPNRPVQQTVPVAGTELARCGGMISLQSQTPGRLRVLINGKEVVSQTFWSYQPPGYAYLLDSMFNDRCAGVEWGDEVTITVEPQYLTGDWQVQLWR